MQSNRFSLLLFVIAIMASNGLSRLSPARGGPEDAAGGRRLPQ